MNPSDQIEAIVTRAVSDMRAVETRHRAQRDSEAGAWPEKDADDERDDRDSAEESAGDDRVLGAVEIAALSAAAGG